MDEVFDVFAAHKVIVVPGSVFLALPNPADDPPPSPYFRVSFSAMGEEQIREGFKRMRAAIDECMAKATSQ